MRTHTPEQTYLDKNFSLSDPDLARIGKQLREANLEYMSMSPAEGRILQFLIRGFGIRSVVEVGTLFGFSAICMAKALPPDGRMIAIEKSGDNFPIAMQNVQVSQVNCPIELRFGDGISVLNELAPEGPFDMIFIDANKNGYIDYLNWAERNIRVGGLIVGDNTFLWGALWNQSRVGEVNSETIKLIEEFNQRLADPARYNSILIPTFEGITVAQKLN
jgi:predicted O-methyltransferase YrrM